MPVDKDHLWLEHLNSLLESVIKVAQDWGLVYLTCYVQAILVYQKSLLNLLHGVIVIYDSFCELRPSKELCLEIALFIAIYRDLV